ncbi:MAG: FecR domain-containing protein [Bacteroidetes bacterium]|nr:FecR domain-containing protein [Bacteroidota bacterium]
MDQSEKDIVQVIIKYIGKAPLNAQENAILRTWLTKSMANRRKFVELTKRNSLKEKLKVFDTAGKNDNDVVWKKIQEEIGGGAQEKSLLIPAGKRPLRMWKYAVAAMVIIAAGTILYFLKSGSVSNGELKNTIASVVNDAAPGTDRAMLTLADGSKIMLDSTTNGELARQGRAIIKKSADGNVTYTEGQASSDVLMYNTLSTPRGGQFQLTLPDGSKVWLNAASSIKYPVSFSGTERHVFITGEAYFEVSHLSGSIKPFIVSKGNKSISVLGTHFDVNAYDDEADMKVTLLEGLVKVSRDGNPDARFLKPGQQAQVSDSKAITVSNDADLDEVMAWKNGNFLFPGTSIESVMRQISRWYDVDVHFEEKVDAELGGRIPRSANLSTVLKALEATGKVRFRIEGKNVAVMAVR